VLVGECVCTLSACSCACSEVADLDRPVGLRDGDHGR
jgi:hypothetical protein